MFYSPNGKEVIMQTASFDLPGPIFSSNFKYPNCRTTFKYEEDVEYEKKKKCKHKFINVTKQLNRNDEIETLITFCKYCNFQKINEKN